MKMDSVSDRKWFCRATGEERLCAGISCSAAFWSPDCVKSNPSHVVRFFDNLAQQMAGSLIFQPWNPADSSGQSPMESIFSQFHNQLPLHKKTLSEVNLTKVRGDYNQLEDEDTISCKQWQVLKRFYIKKLLKRISISHSSLSTPGEFSCTAFDDLTMTKIFHPWSILIFCCWLRHKHSYFCMNKRQFQLCTATGSLRFNLWHPTHPSWQPPIENIFCQSEDCIGFHSQSVSS